MTCCRVARAAETDDGVDVPDDGNRSHRHRVAALPNIAYRLCLEMAEMVAFCVGDAMMMSLRSCSFRRHCRSASYFDSEG